jgi:hypothetical protein
MIPTFRYCLYFKAFYSVCRRNRLYRREASPRWFMCDFKYLAHASFFLPHSLISYSLVFPAEETLWCDQCSGFVTSGSLYPYTGLRIRIFLSVAFEMPTKNKFFCLLPVLIVGTLTTVFKDNKSFKSHTTVEKSRFSLIFLLVDGRTRIRTNNHGSGVESWSQKNYDPTDPYPYPEHWIRLMVPF